MKWLRYFLGLSLILNSYAAIAQTPPTSSHVEQMWSLMDVLQNKIQTMKPEPGKTTGETVAATQQALLGVVAQEASMLSPEDFKQFLFESLQRYVSHPEQRSALSIAWKNIRVWIKPELDQYPTQVWQPLAEGIGKWMVLLLVIRGSASVLNKQALLDRFMGSAYLRRLLARANVTSEFKQNLLMAGVEGVAIAGIERMFAQISTHKIDPKPVFEALQIITACDLINSSLDENATSEQLTKALGEARELTDEFSSLEKIDPSDEHVKQILAAIPNDSKLTPIFGHGLSCNLVSLSHLDAYITERLSQLPGAAK